MASVLVPGVEATSSGGFKFLCVSGVFRYSGRPVPITGVQLRLDWRASGYVYVGLSGGVTMTSGVISAQSGHLMDGMQLGPGDPYFLPKGALGPSGLIDATVLADAACSGQARLYWEMM